MALTDSDLAYLRSEIGDAEPPDDADLSDAFDRLGSLASVAAEVVRKRLATMLADPAQFSVEGYSENNAANITALTKQLARLDAAAAPSAVVDGTATTERLVRCGWER